jgi:nicotinamide-nucleotide amidase
MTTTQASIPRSATLDINVELLSIGDELLSGTIANKNAQWISSKITKAGGLVKRITTVGDSFIEISDTVKECIERKPGWLIISGGLGPTYDDQTLQGLGNAIGHELILDPRAVEMLRKSYVRNPFTKHYRLNDTRLKMAKIPRGSVPIQNAVGSAPSVRIDVNNDRDTHIGVTRIFCLPGVPKEMKAVFSNSVMPLFKELIGSYYFVESVFETIGVSESMLAPTLSRIVNSYSAHDIYLKTHPKGYRATTYSKLKTRSKLNIQVVSKGRDKFQVESRYTEILKTLREEIRRLGGKLYLSRAQRKISK